VHRLIGEIPGSLKPWMRLAILLMGVVGLSILSYALTGTVIPTDSRHANIFQSGLLLVILGSLFLEDKFTRPADVVVNGLTGIISLLTVAGAGPGPWWTIVFFYCLVVFLMAAVCIVLGVPGEIHSPRGQVNRVLYDLSTAFGSSRVLFSVVFLYAVLSFYGFQSSQAALLLLFWGFYVALWPLRLPHVVQALLTRGRHTPSRCGSILRMESPDIVRVELSPGADWTDQSSKVACTGDGRSRVVLPLFTQAQDDRLVGTGLCLSDLDAPVGRVQRGEVYTWKQDVATAQDVLQDQFELDSPALPIGLVSEDSRIAKVNFETWGSGSCEEGQLVFSVVNGRRVFYQVIEGNTREETLTKHRHGFQVAEATQLGVLDKARGFVKFPWLPSINAPIFSAAGQAFPEMPEAGAGQVVLGNVPGSPVPVIADIGEMRSHHTAILGVTGTGKTELAFDLIRSALEEQTKVFCVDLTGFYGDRLSDLSPVELGLESALADDLGKHLFEAETGQYGAGKEKKELKKFADPIRADIESKVAAFMEKPEQWLGVFSLPSISNTKATVYATEVYLSSVFRFAREGPRAVPIWIVLEEAHTVIPEPNTMGLGDYESRGMVAKIAQIALQGRKYDVGLLVIAQRTATVSKTVLTQCNTMIAFSTYDQTGIEFMSNFYGSDYARLAPNLRFLQAIAFGRGIRSERPLVIEIPYDQKKAEIGAAKEGQADRRENRVGTTSVIVQ
jgi:hypothetical protein